MTTHSVDVDTAAMPVAEPPPAPPDEAGGWLLEGRYRIRERLGNGGVADVFRATDEHLGRDVAVKVFRTGVDATADAERRDVELHTLARLSHPNLVTLFDASVAEPDHPDFLVMELVEGRTLAAALAEGALPAERVREIGVQIAGALAYVHESGVVHRDVKPGNILLGSDGAGGLRACLADFGVARIVGSDRLTNVGFTVGTAAYLAPEQVRGAEVGPAADVYSLGLVLIEALTGRRCYEGTAHEAAVARLSAGPRVPGDLPEPWPDLLVAMTAAEPEARPTAAEVALSLGTRRVPDALPQTPPAVVPVAADAASTTAELPVFAEPSQVTALPAARRRRVRAPVFLLAALIALGIVATAGWVLASTGDSAPTPHPPATSQHTRAPVSHAVRSKHATSTTQVAPPVVRHARTSTSSAPRPRASSTVVPSTTTTSTTVAPPATSTSAATSSTPAPSPSASASVTTPAAAPSPSAT